MPYKQITPNLNPSELTVIHYIVHALTNVFFPQFKGEMKTRLCNTASNTKVWKLQDIYQTAKHDVFTYCHL